jgi:hypothetical protein
MCVHILGIVHKWLIFVCVCARARVRARACVCVCLYIYIYIYIYIVKSTVSPVSTFPDKQIAS